MEDKDCGCGRSPTGKCVGWHNLTNEQYEKQKARFEEMQLNESTYQLLIEENRGSGVSTSHGD